MAATVSSYKLEAPRPRPPPLPIRTNTPSRPPSRIAGSKDTARPLLYDLPSATPTSPQYPASPVSPTGRSQSRASRSRGMTPPPHERAPTPSRPLDRDLEKFAEVCKAWYYNQDDNAGGVITQTLATLPAAHRAPYSRLQASIRSAYHASLAARRNAEFQAHVTATSPGGSLMPASRADPAGPLAQRERLERFERFVKAWCVTAMPGTKPFFTGLWAVMRLSVIPKQLGGAGGNRIEWEIDDAVFKEAAGKGFMLEAIDILKGVLGFEEVCSSKRSLNSPAPYSPFAPLTPIHSRSQSTPLPSDLFVKSKPTKPPPISSTTQTKRPRAPSDPFLDSHVPTPPISASFSSANTMWQLSTSASSTVGEPSCPPTPQNEVADPFHPAPQPIDLSDTDVSMRTWTAPDLSNAELLSLLKVFPAFVMQNPLPRFPRQPFQTPRDIEEGEDVDIDGKMIRVGTGTMWVGTRRRTPGWEGSWWNRFKQWLKRLFC